MIPTKRSFLKVLHNDCKVKEKDINFEQYARIHLDGHQIAICDTVSDTVLVLNSSYTTKDNYFGVAIDEAGKDFNEMMLDFVYKKDRNLRST